MADNLNAEKVKALTDKVLNETKKIIVGKDNEIKMVIMSILSDGHVLLEDLPGSGKTTLIKTISRALGLDFGRIQFVPDLLPSDITGMVIYNQNKGSFEYRRGPVMTNILLADEINRAIPRTQSALLEAMEEKQVTIDNERYELPKPFIVLATQNPVEMESTFKLPAAQIDRFLIKLSLGYLSNDEEIEMLKNLGDGIPFDDIKAVTNREEILELQNSIKDVYLSDDVIKYIVSLCAATRDHADVRLGISARGSKALYKATKAWALMNGRDFVTPDDVKEVAVPVLSHRLVLEAEAKYSGKTQEQIIKDLLSEIHVGMDAEEIVHRI